VCPYHAWRYGTDGRLEKAPGIDLAAGHGDTALPPVDVQTWRGFVFVRLTSEGPSLLEVFGEAFGDLEKHLPAVDRLRYVKRFVHDVDGNWKVLVDNYLECYHCPPNHPSFVDLMRVRQYEIKTFKYHSTHRAPAGRPDNTAYRFEAGRGHGGFDGWWLWPNLTFNIFPGTDNLLVFQMHPLSPDTSIGYCDYLFPDGAINEQAEALMQWETYVLSEEDNERVASVHRGMKSLALSRGVLVVNPGRGDITEHAIGHFHSLVSQAVGL
jgi:phenylpropionate dioxygenase-like ring-hydroxylating dioxygenase large terminal subunit